MANLVPLVRFDRHLYSPLRYNLEMSRYMVVILSTKFLQKKDSCHELAYAFERLQWMIQTDYYWKYLWIVLYDLTINEYKIARQSNPILPEIPIGVQCIHFHQTRRYWSTLCHEIKAKGY